MAPTRIRTAKSSSLPARLKPRRSPQQGRAKALVAAILEAGSRILVARGFEQLSMQQVATVAGVSPGSLYQYFPDKGSLVAAIIEAQSEREVAFHAERFAQLAPDADLFETIETILRSLLEFQRREGALMRRTLEALAFLGRYPSLGARVRDTSQLVQGLLARHRGAVAVDDPQLATHVLTNALHSLTHDGVLPRPASLDDETLLREAMRLVRGYLLTPA